MVLLVWLLFTALPTSTNIQTIGPFQTPDEREVAKDKLERNLKASGVCMRFDTPPQTQAAPPHPEPPK